jgi:phosphohistidine phosphatase
MAGLRIYFLRHGKALSRTEWEHDDRRRPLTPEGVAEMRRIGATLVAMDVAPDVLVSSPLARARHTAELIAEALGADVKPVLDERLAPGFGAADLEAIVTERRPAAAIMLVGHEPDFSTVIGALTGGRVVCKKGGLARVDVDETDLGSGDLVWLLPPSLLAKE